jgi:hypothetical protein
MREVIGLASSAPVTGPMSRWSTGDGNDLATFDQIVAAYEVGSHSVVVETLDGREIRITAWRDLSTHQYVSAYERRTKIKNGMQDLYIWANSPAYQTCSADDLEECLEAAMLEVDRARLF